MFTDFLFHLRAHGIKVSLTEWLPLMRALAGGHARADLTVFYHLARALLVKTETLYDLYDRAFAEYFAGIDAQFDLSDELLEWLEDPRRGARRPRGPGFGRAARALQETARRAGRAP